MFNILRLLGLKPNKEQKAETQDSSDRHIANANVVGRFFCLFGFHKWSGLDYNICQICKKRAVGLPLFENPPPCPQPMNHDFQNSSEVAAAGVVDCEK